MSSKQLVLGGFIDRPAVELTVPLDLGAGEWQSEGCHVMWHAAGGDCGVAAAGFSNRGAANRWIGRWVDVFTGNGRDLTVVEGQPSPSFVPHASVYVLERADFAWQS